MPRRGSPDAPRLDARRQELLTGALRLVEYTARDAKGTPLITGLIVVPMTAIAEYQDPEKDTGLRSEEERLSTATVRASIPYRAGIASIAFQQLEPDPKTEPQSWQRRPIGEAPIPQ